MKRIYWLVSTLVVVAALLMGWRVGNSVQESANPVVAQTGTVDATLLQSRMGITFTVVDPQQVEREIRKDEAIARAKEEAPEWTEATAINAELGYLGNGPTAEVAGLETTPLVWWISFQGVISYGSGEPGTETETTSRVSNEYNVIIDAYSGKRIFSVIYR